MSNPIEVFAGQAELQIAQSICQTVENNLTPYLQEFKTFIAQLPGDHAYIIATQHTNPEIQAIMSELNITIDDFGAVVQEKIQNDKRMVHTWHYNEHLQTWTEVTYLSRSSENGALQESIRITRSHPTQEGSGVEVDSIDIHSPSGTIMINALADWPYYLLPAGTRDTVNLSEEQMSEIAAQLSLFDPDFYFTN